MWHESAQSGPERPDQKPTHENLLFHYDSGNLTGLVDGIFPLASKTHAPLRKDAYVAS